MGGDSAITQDSPANKECNACRVHAGFQFGWRRTRPLIMPHLIALQAEYPTYQLTLVGHSLGGAIAALAGLECDARGWGPIVTTYGEPRLGNEAMSQYINTVFSLSPLLPSSSRHQPPKEEEEEEEEEDEERKTKRSTKEDAIEHQKDHDMNQIVDAKEKSQRYRRVTHLHDPIPLLPLHVSGGYTPHAGEIFIATDDLPPSVLDVRHCKGDSDSECSAASELFLPFSFPSSSSSSSSFPSWGMRFEDSASTSKVRSESTSYPTPENPNDDDDANDEEKENESSIPISIPGLILGNGIFAHRDYFIRLGTCFHFPFSFPFPFPFPSPS